MQMSLLYCRSTEDVEDVRREVQIMHHLAGHPNVTLLKGAYEDRHHVHLVSRAALLCTIGSTTLPYHHRCIFLLLWPKLHSSVILLMFHTFLSISALSDCVKCAGLHLSMIAW